MHVRIFVAGEADERTLPAFSLENGFHSRRGRRCAVDQSCENFVELKKIDVSVRSRRRDSSSCKAAAFSFDRRFWS